MINDPNSVQILKDAKSILLIDWPDESVSSTLLNAGFTVYSYSPDSYSEAKENEKGHLVFQELESKLTAVDIVNIFRPENELAGILEKHVLPLRAKAVWLQPPLISVVGRELAATNHLEFIEGVAIADVAAII